LKKRGNKNEVKKKFSLWLRASTLNPSRGIVIRVAGFEEEAKENDISTASDNDESEVDKEKASLLALDSMTDTTMG